MITKQPFKNSLNSLNILLYTVAVIGMSYLLVFPRALPIRGYQSILLVADVLLVWVIVPIIIKTKNYYVKANLVSLVALIQLLHIHMDPVFIQYLSVYMIINIIGKLILSILPSRKSDECEDATFKQTEIERCR